RAAQAAELVARAQAAHWEAYADDEEEDDVSIPSEFPERWSRFLPPDDVKARLHAGRDPKDTRDTGKSPRAGKDEKDTGDSREG
ncbi:YihY/virulence factor BrkB family protein, partial [Streptomyces sp. SID3915]|nr:YihY/virulence factor BrkB family protein [Streptomyces sp. SID3915]